MTDQPIEDVPETVEAEETPKPRKRTAPKRVTGSATDRARMIALERLKNR